MTRMTSTYIPKNQYNCQKNFVNTQNSGNNGQNQAVNNPNQVNNNMQNQTGNVQNPVQNPNPNNAPPTSSVGAVNITINNPTAGNPYQQPYYVPYPYPVQTPVKQVVQPVVQPVAAQQVAAKPAAAPIDLEKTKAEKTEKKDDKKKQAVPLTDEYIQTMENYLNNSNADLRTQAAKEIFDRYKELDSRKDNPSLAGLLNLALQDPTQKTPGFSHQARTWALLAIESGFAYGNDETVQILKNIQQSNDNYNMDAVAASNALLKLTGKKIDISTDDAAAQPIQEQSKTGQKLDVTAA